MLLVNEYYEHCPEKIGQRNGTKVDLGKFYGVP
jgi:hypothetical protein